MDVHPHNMSSIYPNFDIKLPKHFSQDLKQMFQYAKRPDDMHLHKTAKQLKRLSEYVTWEKV